MYYHILLCHQSNALCTHSSSIKTVRSSNDTPPSKRYIPHMLHHYQVTYHSDHKIEKFTYAAPPSNMMKVVQSSHAAPSPTQHVPKSCNQSRALLTSAAWLQATHSPHCTLPISSTFLLSSSRSSIKAEYYSHPDFPSKLNILHSTIVGPGHRSLSFQGH